MSLPLSIYEQMPTRLPHSLGWSKYTLDFDGEDDYVDIPTIGYMEKQSLSVWVKFDSIPSENLVIYNQRDSDNNQNAMILYYTDTGELKTGITDPNGNKVSVTYPWIPNTGQRYYFSAVKVDDSTGYLYIDGSSVGTLKTISTTVGTVNTGAIGAYYDGSLNFPGTIDGVRFYNRANSPSTIRRNMLNYHNPTREGLVLWLPFEEGQGLTAYDSSEEGNDGTLEPAADPPVWIDVEKWELRSEVGL